MIRIPDRTERTFIWVLGLGVLVAGVAFFFKIAGFIYSLSSQDFRGTFDVGITVYFAVTAGWLCLLCWSYVTGRLGENERVKYDLLRKEEDYERHGI